MLLGLFFFQIIDLLLQSVNFISQVIVLHCNEGKAEKLTSQEQKDNHQWYQGTAGIQDSEISQPNDITTDQKTREDKEKPCYPKE